MSVATKKWILTGRRKRIVYEQQVHHQDFVLYHGDPFTKSPSGIYLMNQLTSWERSEPDEIILLPDAEHFSMTSTGFGT